MKILDFFKIKKKEFSETEAKKRIEEEIEELKTLKDGFYIKSKEFKKEYYINVIIDKRVLGIDADTSKIPDFLIFLFVVDYTYPEDSPKILSKSNFSNPTLKDGRDLLFEIYPSWSKESKLKDIAQNIPKFLSKVINFRGFKFYGKFHLGAIYDLKNFESLATIIEVEDENPSKFTKPVLSTKDEYVLILSGDAIVLFKILDSGNGKVVFWGSLYGITDLQMNKKNKNVKMYFYDDEDMNAYILQLNIENIVLFRDTLTKKVRSLGIRAQSTKIEQKQMHLLRLSTKEIYTMGLTDIEKNVKDLEERINKGEITDYTVTTFSNLCGKAMEKFSIAGDDLKSMYYLKLMKDILSKEEVKKLTEEQQKQIEGEEK